MGACKLFGELLQINPYGLLHISDSVALCFVHLNSVVLPSNSQGFDNPAFHDVLATEFPAHVSLEQFPGCFWA